MKTQPDNVDDALDGTTTYALHLNDKRISTLPRCGTLGASIDANKPVMWAPWDWEKRLPGAVTAPIEDESAGSNKINVDSMKEKITLFLKIVAETPKLENFLDLNRFTELTFYSNKFQTELGRCSNWMVTLSRLE